MLTITTDAAKFRFVPRLLRSVDRQFRQSHCSHVALLSQSHA